jgi:hypothetical protein
MGLFNIVKLEREWTSCKELVNLKIQFKHGYLDIAEYNVGDKIKWSSEREFANTGFPSMGRVVIDGVDLDCPVCRFSQDWYVFIDNGVIEKVVPATEDFDFSKSTWIKLD